MEIREAMLATAEKSPTAVADHDRTAWLALFDDGGLVNDPVGSAPHRGSEELGAFYDTFIAPNTVVFHPEHDIVCGDTVVRDLTLEIQMADGVTLLVPAHLRYVLASPSRIAGLYAHWELPSMVGQMLGKGAGALPVSGRLSLRLLKNQGLAGSLGFARGFVRTGAAHKRIAAAFFDDPVASDAPVTYDAAPAVPSSTLRDELIGWHVGKAIAAGDYVTLSLTRGRPSGETEHAVAMCRFTHRTLTDVTVYVDA
ncbi:nuclear transport factor 2 family protein [Gordonia phthalatica]|uniref:SnoaL-like domain-containing protein n=1 Tax=Gordonia phthalatica TaxID=1136941 RepID=A0A0N7FV46_9ACTN|nr:nuclear transport factor 2 family protein [Gordonia phthalatica]ALG86143.1 hypothetical protein ACH46_18645 [Gordonia phthalatica]